MHLRIGLGRHRLSLHPELHEAPQEGELLLREQGKDNVRLFLGGRVKELLRHLLAHVVLTGASVRKELSDACLTERSKDPLNNLGFLEALLFVDILRPKVVLHLPLLADPFSQLGVLLSESHDLRAALGTNRRHLFRSLPPTLGNRVDQRDVLRPQVGDDVFRVLLILRHALEREHRERSVGPQRGRDALGHLERHRRPRRWADHLRQSRLVGSVDEIIDHLPFGVDRSHLTTAAVRVADGGLHAFGELFEIGLVGDVEGPSLAAATAGDNDADEGARMLGLPHLIEPFLESDVHGVTSQRSSSILRRAERSASRSARSRQPLRASSRATWTRVTNGSWPASCPFTTLLQSPGRPCEELAPTALGSPGISVDPSSSGTSQSSPARFRIPPSPLLRLSHYCLLRGLACAVIFRHPRQRPRVPCARRLRRRCSESLCSPNPRHFAPRLRTFHSLHGRIESRPLR